MLSLAHLTFVMLRSFSVRRESWMLIPLLPLVIILSAVLYAGYINSWTIHTALISFWSVVPILAPVFVVAILEEWARRRNPPPRHPFMFFFLAYFGFSIVCGLAGGVQLFSALHCRFIDGIGFGGVARDGCFSPVLPVFNGLIGAILSPFIAYIVAKRLLHE